MNEFAVTRRGGFFRDLAARMQNGRSLRNSEEWRREFIIAPVLTSPWGLDLRPWDIECEVSFPLTKEQRDKIKTHFGKRLFRVRPDYIVCPQDKDAVTLVVEAKKDLTKNNIIDQHKSQVLIEQLVTKAPWAILTDGEVWMLFLDGQPLLSAASLSDLCGSISHWQQLVGRRALCKSSGGHPSLMHILISSGEALQGRDPTQQEKKRLESFFPQMASHGFRVVAEESYEYNSIGAVVGDRGHWWEPDPMGAGYWPKGAPREYSLSAYRDAFASMGFAECSHEALETDRNKIVIFAKGETVTHSTCQTRTGLWVSKLGCLHEVLHELYDLKGDEFGEPVLIMGRTHTNENSQQPAPAYSVPAARPLGR